MTRYTLTSGIVAGFLSLIALSAAVAQSQSYGSAASQSAADLEATPVTVGQLSGTDLRLSKLYRPSRTDFDRETRLGHDKHVVRLEGMPEISTIPQSKSNLLVAKLCSSDAVFVGTPRQRRSQLTEDHSWIFSIVDVHIDSVIKQMRSRTIAAGDSVQVTRSGGAVVVNGHLAEASEPGGRLARGQQYVFFVKYLTDSDVFWARGPYDSYVLDKGALRPLPGLANITFSGTNLSELSSAVATGSCK